MRLDVATYRTVARWSLIFLALANVGVLFVEMGLGWDFAVFYDAGRKVVAGEATNLYKAAVPIAGQPSQGKMEFAGTPLAATYYTILAQFSPRVAMFLFKLQNSLVYLAALWLLFRHCRRYVEPSDLKQTRFAALFLLILIVYQPLWTVYRVGGQTTPTVFLLLVAGWLLHQRGMLWRSAAVLVLVVTIKPVFTTMLVLLAVISGSAFLVRSALLGLGAGLLSVGILGWPVHQMFLDFMLEISNRSPAWIYNSGITVPLASLRLQWDPAPYASGPTSADTAILLVRLTVFVAFAWMIILSRRQSWAASTRRHFDWAIAIALTLMIAPIVWEHYLVMLLIPLVFLIANEDRIPRGAWRLAIVAVALCAFQNLVVVQLAWDNTTGAMWPVHLGIALVKAAPLLLTFVLLVLYRRPVFASFAIEPQAAGDRDDTLVTLSTQKSQWLTSP